MLTEVVTNREVLDQMFLEACELGGSEHLESLGDLRIFEA